MQRRTESGEACYIAKGEYHPRNPRESPLFQVIEDWWEDFEASFEERYEREYGFFRDVIHKGIFRFLECGDPHHGFARIRCPDCGSSLILAFSCKTRLLCPSCQAKRALVFSTHLAEEVLQAVPVRHLTFTIPKLLRRAFRNDRNLLRRLCACAYETVHDLYPAAVQEEGAVCGAVIGVHTAGNSLNFHPHAHAIVADGCFLPDGNFTLLPRETDREKAENLFRQKVLSMLLREGRITKLTAERLLTWHHSGFNVHAGERVAPDEKQRREHLARYLVRAPLALDKLTYLPDEGKVLYGPRSDRKTFHPLDFLAELTQHIPEHYEHRVHHYGEYSSRRRGIATKKGEQETPGVRESSMSRKSCNKAWAALIRKIYEVDPLTCSKCGGTMRIIAFIHDPEPVRAILEHLKLWEYPRRAPPKKAPLPVQQLLFPRRQQAFRYTTGDEDEARTAPELIAAEAWGEYHAEPVPIEAYAIDPPFFEE